MTTATATKGPAPQIMIATPCFGGQATVQYLHSVLALQRALDRQGIGNELVTLAGESLITRGRNNLVAHFLDRPAFTHLFFLDADIGFRPEGFLRLLAFNRPVVCGAYPLKGIDWRKVREVAARGGDPESAALNYVISARDPTATVARVKAVDGFASVDYGGTGFMLIQRGVFDRLMQAHPELKFDHTHFVNRDGKVPSTHQYAFFDTGIDPATRTYLSEDYFFCKLWTDLGGEIWLDLQSKLDHVGSHVYRGDMATQIQRNPS